MIDQRSPEWYAQRRGKVTASNLHKVVRQTGSKSKTRDGYMAELLAERFGADLGDMIQTRAIKNGVENEDTARMAYEIATGNSVDKAGFFDHPTIKGFGASPDGLIGRVGGLEIKCPETKKHLETIQTEEIDREYVLQIVGGQACTAREWWDFVSFDPRLPDDAGLWIKRILSDPEQIGMVEAEVKKFLAELEAKAAWLIRKIPDLGPVYAEWEKAAFPVVEKKRRSLL